RPGAGCAADARLARDPSGAEEPPRIADARSRRPADDQNLLAPADTAARHAPARAAPAVPGAAAGPPVRPEPAIDQDRPRAGRRGAAGIGRTRSPRGRGLGARRDVAGIAPPARTGPAAPAPAPPPDRKSTRLN